MKCQRLVVLCAVLALAGLPTQVRAITLFSAVGFGLLGGTGVSNSGSSFVYDGDVGSAPAAAVSGFPPGQVIKGVLYTTPDPATSQAHTDLILAYDEAAAAPGAVPGPADLGGATLGPGVYFYASTAPWTAGNLTLDGNGDPDAEWVFQIGTGLTTPADASVVLLDGAQAKHVFWQIGSSATLGANNDFAGNILALTSITLGGGILNGRAMAINGLVSISPGTSVFVPEPGSIASVGAALVSLLALGRARLRRRG